MRSLADSGIHRENWARAEWTDLDDQFLSWIVDLSRNPRLRIIVDSQADQIYRALYTISHRPKPTRSILEHKAIVAALKASASYRDVAGAGRVGLAPVVTPCSARAAAPRCSREWRR
jgi:DNA-binding GntR family transcriptional regulator